MSSTDDANQCLHNKSGSHWVPNIILSNFVCLLVDFNLVLWCCVHVPTSSSKTQTLYSTNVHCFVRDSSCLRLTFVAFCLLSVIHKQ